MKAVASSQRIEFKKRDVAASMNDPCCAPAGVWVDTTGIAQQVKLLSAIADPTRLQIVRMLSTLEEPLCVCEIVGQFELGQPTISHHLKVLRDAGLVTWEKRGLWVYYSLDRHALRQVASYLNGLLEEVPEAAQIR